MSINLNYVTWEDVEIYGRFLAFSPSSLLPWLRDVTLFLSVRSTIP